jgi:hypothetical protein
MSFQGLEKGSLLRKANNGLKIKVSGVWTNKDSRSLIFHKMKFTSLYRRRKRNLCSNLLKLFIE